MNPEERVPLLAGVPAGPALGVCSPALAGLQALSPPLWLTLVSFVQDALRLRGEEARGERGGSAARHLPGGREPPAEWTRCECFPCLWEPLLWCLLPLSVPLGRDRRRLGLCPSRQRDQLPWFGGTVLDNSLGFSPARSDAASTRLRALAAAGQQR